MDVSCLGRGEPHWYAVGVSDTGSRVLGLQLAVNAPAIQQSSTRITECAVAGFSTGCTKGGVEARAVSARAERLHCELCNVQRTCNPQ